MFSIDAITNSTYEKVRRGGKFNIVLENLENCIKKNGKDNITVSFTCKTPNIAEVSKVKEFYTKNFGVNTQIT